MSPQDRRQWLEHMRNPDIAGGRRILMSMRNKGMNVWLDEDGFIQVEPESLLDAKIREGVRKREIDITAALRDEAKNPPPAAVEPTPIRPPAPPLMATPEEDMEREPDGPPPEMDVSDTKGGIRFTIQTKKVPYAQIPKSLFELPAKYELTQSSSHLIFQIAYLVYGWQEGQWNGEIRDLADRCACTSRTIYNALKELEGKGIVKVHRQRDGLGRFVPTVVELLCP